MSSSSAVSASVAIVAAMVTPAILILASASLVASALVRMARVVDRTRALLNLVNQTAWERSGLTKQQLRASLERHGRRATYAERSITLLYGAAATFVLTCVAIPLDVVVDESIKWLPAALAVSGTLLLLGGSAYMVAECRLSNAQITEEIAGGLQRLEGHADELRAT